MRMSARILGQAFGLTGQEMNALLKQEGFLDGEPGAYSVTDKGEPYAEEKHEHRGTGGYSWYNRDWTTRTWDESISDELDVTEDKKRQIRQQVADARRAARQLKVEEELEPQPTEESEQRDIDVRPILIAAGALAAAFGIYKAAPRIRRFVSEKVAPRFKRTQAEVPGASEAIEDEGDSGEDPARPS